MTYFYLDVLLACGMLLVGYLYNKKKWAKPSFPPGPNPLPLIGNLLDLPKEKPWERYSQWAKDYGKCPLPSRQLTMLITRQAISYTSVPLAVLWSF